MSAGRLRNQASSFTGLLMGVLMIALAACSLASADSVDLKITLLGTGGPEMTTTRQGYATLIEAGSQKLLFDAGRGVTQRIYEAQVDLTDITRIFITHLHNDHIEGLPTLWMTPWYLLGRDQPLQVWGPPGTQATIDGMRAMYWFDLQHRVNQFNKLENLDVKVVEIDSGEIYNRDGLKVTAFPVWHDDGNPALGYRIDYRHRVVVLSGDTTYSSNVVQQGQHADLIVHNVVAMSQHLSQAPEMHGVLGKLTTPEQAARVFRETQPRMAVFSHIVKKELPGRRGDAEILRRVRAAGYQGPLQMGEDLMTIEIGESIRIIPPSSIAQLPELDRKRAAPTR